MPKGKPKTLKVILKHRIAFGLEKASQLKGKGWTNDQKVDALNGTFPIGHKMELPEEEARHLAKIGSVELVNKAEQNEQLQEHIKEEEARAPIIPENLHVDPKEGM